MDFYDLLIDVLYFLGALFFVIMSYYFKTRASIRDNADNAVNDAEDLDIPGPEKFKAAVDQVMSCVPVLIKPIIPRSFVEVIVQNSFEMIDT